MLGDGGHPEAGGPCGLEDGGRLWVGGPYCVRAGGRPGGGVPHHGGDRGHPELQVPRGVVDRGHPGLGGLHGAENGGCLGAGDPAGECCGEMRPSGCCSLRVWCQLRCSVPVTHIPERPLRSFPMAGMALGGPDLDPSPCLAACPSLGAGTQGAAWGRASVYPPATAVYPYFWTPRTARAGEGLCCRLSLARGAPAPHPVPAGVMPWPWRLACLRLHCPAPSWLFQPCLCHLPCPSPRGRRLTVPC